MDFKVRSPLFFARSFSTLIFLGAICRGREIAHEMIRGSKTQQQQQRLCTYVQRLPTTIIHRAMLRLKLGVYQRSYPKRPIHNCNKLDQCYRNSKYEWLNVATLNIMTKEAFVTTLNRKWLPDLSIKVGRRGHHNVSI